MFIYIGIYVCIYVYIHIYMYKYNETFWSLGLLIYNEAICYRISLCREMFSRFALINVNLKWDRSVIDSKFNLKPQATRTNANCRHEHINWYGESYIKIYIQNMYEYIHINIHKHTHYIHLLVYIYIHIYTHVNIYIHI